jgi:hypothetical protein
MCTCEYALHHVISTDLCTDLTQICLRIVTGTATSNEGNLEISVNDVVVKSLWSSRGSVVLDQCFEAGSSITVTNPTTDAWTGTIAASVNGGLTYYPMSCAACTGGSVTDKIVVDGDSNSEAQASTRCFAQACTMEVTSDEPCGVYSSDV